MNGSQGGGLRGIYGGLAIQKEKTWERKDGKKKRRGVKNVNGGKRTFADFRQRYIIWDLRCNRDRHRGLGELFLGARSAWLDLQVCNVLGFTISG